VEANDDLTPVPSPSGRGKLRGEVVRSDPTPHFPSPIGGGDERGEVRP